MWKLDFFVVVVVFQVKILSQELDVERKRFPPMEDRIVSLESDLASQEDAVRYVEHCLFEHIGYDLLSVNFNIPSPDLQGILREC